MINKKNLLRRLEDAAAVEDRSSMSNLLKEAAEALRFYSVIWFDPEERLPRPGQHVLMAVEGYVSDGYLNDNKRWIRNGMDLEKVLGQKVNAWAPIPKAPDIKPKDGEQP